MSGNDDQLGLRLEGSDAPWPPAARFPYNFGGEAVGGLITRDLLVARHPLLITGYASVERLLGFFLRWAQASREPDGPVRLLVGVEPTRASAPGTPRTPVRLEGEIAEYWLSRGISLLNSQELLATVQLLEAGRLRVRSSAASRVHAKVYLGDLAVTLGSSNFTRPGLETNLEANARFARDKEAERYEEAAALAENLWRLGSDYEDGFRDLLDRLLQKVTWQEALARACADILEGEWPGPTEGGRGPLWPSQEQGIGQALWVLENHGAVLLADATGSGKTRVGARLLRVLQDRRWRMGRARARLPVVVCPPAVRTLWRRELAEADESINVFSHGVLSFHRSERHDEVGEALRRTQLLAVDEAHNFLNRMSRRSRMIYGNVADNVVLLTATPINRGARDLLAIVELMGADNFDDDVLKVVGRLAKQQRSGRGGPMQPSEREQLRSALQEFVVRRTKADFNRLIDRDPDMYVNVLGQRCRYPEHEPVVFERTDPPPDCGRAIAVREKAKNLRGVVNFRGPVRMPAFLRLEGWTEERFLTMRLRGAAALAGYQVRSRLRSSSVALIEHILGTREAGRRFDIEGVKSSRSGDVIGTLQNIAGKPPKVGLTVEVPSWLSDPEEHRRAAEEEIETYRDILRQAEEMSEHRLDANADYLLSLLEKHERLLAFDGHLISLYALRPRLLARGAKDVALATGERGMASRRAFSREFALESRKRGVIGLCSDALAEGLNLQGASAVVHLDLPSVIRVLEQRIGRVDRMDSPHRSVEVHWPKEPDAFRIRSDERLFWRLQDVEDLLGSNVPIPKEFEGYSPDQGDFVALSEVIEAVEREEAPDAAMTLADAFTRVRELVFGDRALVTREVYESVRKSEARVLSSVAVVSAREVPWVFLAVGAADRSAPRWVLVEQGRAGRVEGALDAVAEAVRDRLSPSPADAAFDERAAKILEDAIRTAERHQSTLLPRRKRRALEELEQVVGHYQEVANGEGDRERREVAGQILDLLEEPRDSTIDLGRLADWWLRLIRSEWHDHLSRRGVRRPARIRHLRARLKSDPISTERLETVTGADLGIESLDRRVVAAIVGVSGVSERDERGVGD